jgi:hypothetical protein
VNGIGSRNDGCTVYNFEDGIHVRSGCWFGTKDEFQEQVFKVHGENRHAKEYTLAVQLAEIKFTP